MALVANANPAPAMNDQLNRAVEPWSKPAHVPLDCWVEDTLQRRYKVQTVTRSGINSIYGLLEWGLLTKYCTDGQTWHACTVPAADRGADMRTVTEWVMAFDERGVTVNHPGIAAADPQQRITLDEFTERAGLANFKWPPEPIPATDAEGEATVRELCEAALEHDNAEEEFCLHNDGHSAENAAAALRRTEAIRKLRRAAFVYAKSIRAASEQQQGK